VIEIHGTWDPESKGGAAPDGRKVKGTIHWASATESVECEVRMYDRLFTSENPAAEEGEFTDYLNPESVKVITAFIETCVKGAAPLTHYQFERVGYFNMDLDATAEKPVFNLTTPLRGK
jgi:glutaminyl-tRNA synthetase